MTTRLLVWDRDLTPLAVPRAGMLDDRWGNGRGGRERKPGGEGRERWIEREERILESFNLQVYEAFNLLVYVALSYKCMRPLTY